MIRTLPVRGRKAERGNPKQTDERTLTVKTKYLEIALIGQGAILQRGKHGH